MDLKNMKLGEEAIAVPIDIDGKKFKTNDLMKGSGVLSGKLDTYSSESKDLVLKDVEVEMKIEGEVYVYKAKKQTWRKKK